MRQFILLVLISIFVGSSASAEVITNSVSITSASKSMEAAGYKQTGLDILTGKPNLDLQFWNVDQGVLIFTYSVSSKEIAGMSFFVCDDRPKATRTTFRFDVGSFDSATGLMTIKTKR